MTSSKIKIGPKPSLSSSNLSQPTPTTSDPTAPTGCSPPCIMPSAKLTRNAKSSNNSPRKTTKHLMPMGVRCFVVFRGELFEDFAFLVSLAEGMMHGGEHPVGAVGSDVVGVGCDKLLEDRLGFGPIFIFDEVICFAS